MPKFNTFILPGELSHEAPSFWDEGKMGREYRFDCWREDHYCLNALIVEGIGRKRCPVFIEWAGFSIAGATIATLTGKYIVPPNPATLEWQKQIQFHTWEALWQAV